MRKFLAFLLVLSLLPAAVLADDLAAMSIADLVQLRHDVDLEIASRNAAGDGQAVVVDGVAFRLYLVEVGQARDGLPGLGVVLLANNTGSTSMTPLYDLGITVTQGGRPLEVSWVVSDHFTSGTVSTSQSTVIAPGAVDMQVFLGYALAGEGDRVEITLSRKHTRAGEDPFCGTFVADLSGLR